MDKNILEWLWIDDKHDTFALEFKDGIVVGCPPYYKRFIGKTLEQVKAAYPKASTREYYRSSIKFRKRRK